MDEQMEDFIEEKLEPGDVDLDYEFDAPRYFDFNRMETDSEAGEAELWFQFAGSYAPSPLISKFKLGKGILGKSDAISRPDSCGSVNSISRNTTVSSCSDVSNVKDRCKGSDMKDEKKSVSKSSKARISTFMKPTVSHLAKLSKSGDVHSSCLCGRTSNAAIQKSGKSSQSSPVSDNAATKRQKLEIGYLRKVAYLKHHNSLLHKFSKKVTIPKEPDLETHQRAHTRRSFRSRSESSEHAEQKSHTFKARPLNKKILQAPSLLPPKRTGLKLPEFQVFHLKTMERAKQHSSATEMSIDDADFDSQDGVVDLRRQNSNALKEKCQTPTKFKMRSLNSKIFPTKEDISRAPNIRHDVTLFKRESKTPKDEKLLLHAPTELFEKLSLTSELEIDKVSQRKPNGLTKVSKENKPDPLQPEVRKGVGKLKQCGSGYWMSGLVRQTNMNRSLGIR